jgi:hypothetical protein
LGYSPPVAARQEEEGKPFHSSFDIEALVASGLEWITVSIDGVSQSVLKKYRRARVELDIWEPAQARDHVP